MAGHRIIILGAGGTGQDALDILKALDDECAGFLDDRATGLIAGIPVLGPLDMAKSLRDCMFVNALGSPNNYTKRKSLIESLEIPAARFLTIVHPSSVVSPQASLGLGVFVYPLVHVGAGAKLRDHVTVLSSSVINHHCEIQEYSILASHVCLCGGVRIGTSAYIGANATVRQNLNVGAGALVGMGSVVVGDVNAGHTVAGNPARPVNAPTSAAGLRT